MASNAGKPGDDSMTVEKLPEEINEMKIKDEKVQELVFCVCLVALFTSGFDPHPCFHPYPKF